MKPSFDMKRIGDGLSQPANTDEVGMKNLIIINGTMGVGKTATCMELRRLLPRNVFLDGDWCWDATPFVVTDETKAMVLGNIRHLLNSFIGCSEYDNVIFCWVMHEQGILDEVCASLDLGDCAVHRFMLTASEEALAERLSRDIAAGRREPDIITRSAERLRMYNRQDTAKIDVSDIDAKQAAEMIAKVLEG